MTSLIDPIVSRALGAVAVRLSRGAADAAALQEAVAAMGRIRAQVMLFRSRGALRLYDAILAQVARRAPERAEALDLTATERTRVNGGWGVASLAEERAALLEEVTRRADPAMRALAETCLAEIDAILAQAAAGPAPSPGPVAVPAPQASRPVAAAPRRLGPIADGGRPGVSLVTCCMNRNANLMRALPSWLAQGEVAEILIVDWSSTPPVAEDLRAAGIADRRIRILRVEGEPRWVLTYAFNLGFRAAQFDTILKADADIVLAADFFARNRLEDGALIAGNWRDAPPDQPHVNGFFLVRKAALARVGGFNEHITSYGWDDEDLYARMVIDGIRRVNVAAGTIHHLPHSDAERTGHADAAPGRLTLREALLRDTQFLIRRNRFIANAMPDWDARSQPLPFLVLAEDARGMVVKREGWVPSEVPATIAAQADSQALRELLSWRLGREVLALAEPALQRVLDLPEDGASAVDVAVAQRAPGKLRQAGQRALVLALPPEVVARIAGGALAAGLVDLARRIAALDLAPILRLEGEAAPAGLPAPLSDWPVVPAWASLGTPVPLRLADLASGPLPGTGPLRLDLTLADLDGLASPPQGAAPAATAAAMPGIAAPAVSSPRRKLYLDAQHGLGNRLRAIASATCLARASGRELVVVWQADDHCDCRLGDLIEHSGAVIGTRFLEDAARKGILVQNYMTAEPGAVKDAPIRLDAPADLYVRSAFVLKGQASTWEAENAVIRAMRPAAAVRDLVARVRHPNDVAAHVRMQGGQAHEHLPFEAPTNWTAEDHEAIAHWRAKSHFSGFLRRLDALVAEGGARTIFLAADLPETYEVFQAQYGDRLAWLPRTLYDRSAAQLQHALADAILLSRAPRLLGSTWSSFSELAQRLAPEKQVVEMSGTDF